MEEAALEYLRKAFGRFSTVRAGYSAWRRLTERASIPPTHGQSPVELFDTERAVGDLRRHSVYKPVRLRPVALESLKKLAMEQPIRCPNSSIPAVPFESALEYNRRCHEQPFLYGSVTAAETDPMALRIVNDPSILMAVSTYLGYIPQRRRMRLQWSFVCDWSASQRQAFGQTVYYHYDVDDFNFVYLMFYLTDVDADSGAHVMIPGTHRGKPLKWLLWRSWLTDEEVFARYPRTSEVMIADRAGTGFLQDSSCLHKAIAPVSRPRLVFQVRYS